MNSRMPAEQTTDALLQIAQTNIQLLVQMRELGYPDSDLAEVSRAYVLGMQLFSGRFRACGKPFVAHLVGTASVLVWVRAPVPVVVAGLLHAAYQEGDFGNGLFGMNSAKRAHVRRVIGDLAEEYVAAYTRSSRTLEALLATYERFDQLSQREREVLLVQLANELDDYRDNASHFAANRDMRLDKIRRCGPQQAEMAVRLGFPGLGTLLSQVYGEALDTQFPAALQSPEANGYMIVPRSCRKTWWAELCFLSFRIRRKARKILSAG